MSLSNEVQKYKVVLNLKRLIQLNVNLPLMVKYFITKVALIIAFSVAGQNDSLPYKVFKNRLVAHSSIGYNAAPFQLKGNFGQVDKLKYRANLNPIMGIGVAYKWFALNINFKLPGYVRNTSDYGETNYLDLGVKFGVKKWFFTIDLHGYNGFGLKDTDKISNELPSSSKNVLTNSQLQSLSMSINGYRFNNKSFKIKPALGIVGRYSEKANSFYIKYTINSHGITASNGIMPHSYFDNEQALFRSNNISAFDFGAVPGWAHVNNINGWQYGVLAGLGGVIQAKIYNYEGNNRGFLGLAPRYDLKVQGGYNVDNWFLMLTSSFDNKSIRFNDFRYRQMYYYVRLTYGYRFK